MAVFTRKMKAIGFPNEHTFDINDDESVKRLVVWLEDMRIRQYKVMMKWGGQCVCVCLCNGACVSTAHTNIHTQAHTLKCTPHEGVEYTYLLLLLVCERE